MIEVGVALPWHVERIDLKPVYHPVWRYLSRSALGHDRAVVLKKEDHLLAVVGFCPCFPGTGEFWALISPAVDRCPREFAKKAKSMLETFIVENKLRRVQMLVRAGHDEAFRFAEFLGFEAEGIMRGYGPEGDDYYMMGRVI